MKTDNQVKTDLKITIDQLKNYLGTGLKCKVKHRTIAKIDVRNPLFTLDSMRTASSAAVWTYDMTFLDQFGFVGKGFQLNEFKPVCYRLSDLDKHIPELGFVPIEMIRMQTDSNHFKYIERFIHDSEDGSFSLIPFWVATQLFQWHFWPFGDEYFEAGLVIDKLKQS